MNFHIVTLFPESLDSYMNSSIIGRAIRDKKIKVKFYNPRDFVPTPLPPSHKATAGQRKLRGAKKTKPYLRVDDKPFGGGPGMVMEALPIIKAIEKAIRPHPQPLSLRRRGEKNNTLIVWLSPSGKQFTNEYAEKSVRKYKDLIIICGRYEGIDARVKKIFKVEEISVGPYVLTGGELGAMIMMDAISRRIPGVLGKIESVEENRIASSDVYTRPEVLEYKGKKYRVPKVLLSGHHKKIEEWRKKKA